MDQDSLKTQFIEAYDLYADEVFRFCYFKVSDSERAQDIMQDVFTRYWQTLRTGKPVQYPRALLYTIARNRITDWYRKKKEDSLEMLQEEGGEFEGTTGSEIQQSAEYAEILRAVEELDEASKEVVLLRFTEGLSPTDIAALNDESANAVSVRLNRAIKKLQENLHI